MKVKVKAPFFDDSGLHTKGEVCEVKRFNPILMEPVVETKKVEKAVKKDPAKTTRKKV